MNPLDIKEAIEAVAKAAEDAENAIRNVMAYRHALAAVEVPEGFQEQEGSAVYFALLRVECQVINFADIMRALRAKK